MIRFIGRYVLNILISIDQLGNTLLFGDPDETISSRAAKRANRFGWKQLGWLLEKIDPGHLRKTREDDEGKNELL